MMTPYWLVKRQNGLAQAGLLLLTAGIALASARDFAGSWNDGSRLATVECLVDYQTLAIDRSIFVRAPNVGRPPYPADDAELVANGTGDKLWIGGHFYSDKSPVPAVLMAGIYKSLQCVTGLKAQDHPQQFCYLLTVATSGLAYVLAVWCVYRLGVILRLTTGQSLLLAGGLALTTVVLPYARHVNNHILLLAVSAAAILAVAGLPDGFRAAWEWRALLLGFLCGLGYSIDLGAGPVMLACTLGFIVYHCRRWRAAAMFLSGAAPWLIFHHVLNYHVGGTIKPANAVPEYFAWPGCAFDSTNMTGSWNHRGLGDFIVYAMALLVGKRGFISHNLGLFVAVGGALVLLCRRVRQSPEIIFACCWCGGTWLAYALTSNNYSGVCCSVRWLVPLLAPGYFMLALFLRHHPSYWRDFLVLSAWGAVLAALMWWRGPWMKHMVPLYWPIEAAALVSWMGMRIWFRRSLRQTGAQDADRAQEAPRAA